ncbi:hypothetical protein BP6252_10240 [Coleophoma cylindrospora]|uniref:Uncharacterized protein n=1 Tax=Coleophoma cylindrospora TaxID=1849047 RepID=A0A3D8QRZ9_9HELO|nr:hypothetical protein BP6252_10240 [Coleophoma cylindrospora]
MEAVIKAISDCERKVGKIELLTTDKAATEMTPKALIKLMMKGNSINKTIKKAMKNWEAHPVPPTDAQVDEILLRIERIIEAEERQLTWARNNKPKFDKFGLSGMVKINLTKNKNTAEVLSRLLLDNTPPARMAEAQMLHKRSQESFKITMALYSNATGGEEHEVSGHESD